MLCFAVLSDWGGLVFMKLEQGQVGGFQRVWYYSVERAPHASREEGSLHS